MFGKVESSSNKGLPLSDFDFRSGARGNADYNQGESIGDDLLPLTVFRPPRGTWRIDVSMNALTGQDDDTLSLNLLRVNTDGKFLLGTDFVNIGRLSSAGSYSDLAIDGDGNAYSLNTTNDYLVGVNLETGVATRNGSASQFGVSESGPTALAFTEDGTLYFTGISRDRLYTLSTFTGGGTQVGTMGQVLVSAKVTRTQWRLLGIICTWQAYLTDVRI